MSSAFVNDEACGSLGSDAFEGLEEGYLQASVQAECHLVNDKQLRAVDQRTDDRDHLLLTPAELAGALPLAVANLREQLQTEFDYLVPLGARPVHPGRDEMLTHAEVRKDFIALGDRRDTELDEAMRLPPRHVYAIEEDLAADDLRVLGLEDAAQRPAGRGLSRTVGADQRDDLTFVDLDRDILDAEGPVRITQRKILCLEKHRRLPLFGTQTGVTVLEYL